MPLLVPPRASSAQALSQDLQLFKARGRQALGLFSPPSFLKPQAAPGLFTLFPMVAYCTCLKVTTALKQSSRSPIPSPLCSSPSKHSLVTPVTTVREKVEHSLQDHSVFFFHIRIVPLTNKDISNQRQFLVILP